MDEISGRILLEGWRGEPGPATIYVRLLDTSLIDAPARVVDEVVLRDVGLVGAADGGIGFRIAAGGVNALARYEVGVLVDLDGDGKPSVGDYVNTCAYPVLTQGFPAHVEIRVRCLG